MDLELSELNPAEADAAMAVVKESFEACVAPDYAQQGRDLFAQVVTADYLRSLPHRQGFTLVAKLDSYDIVLGGGYTNRANASGKAGGGNYWYVERDDQMAGQRGRTGAPERVRGHQAGSSFLTRGRVHLPGAGLFDHGTRES